MSEFQHFSEKKFERNYEHYAKFYHSLVYILNKLIITVYHIGHAFLNFIFIFSSMQNAANNEVQEIR